MQFTPDVLPSDIIGFSMFNKDSNNFEYREGSIMTNLFLADEINRTSPKTQSALLEVMEEGSVTVDGTTHNLPSPFIVIATQNPFGSSGTQKLPESQLDRFMVCLSMGYPDHFNAIEILKGEETRFQLSTIISQEQLITMQEEVEKIFVDASIYDYIITLTEATRIHPSLALGISPRGSIALLRIAKASAYYNGRDFVIPQDVTNYIYDVFAHRLARTPAAKSKGITKESILHDIIEGTKQPKLTK